MSSFQNIKEKTSQVYTATIKDDADIALILSRIDTMKLTLFSTHDLAVINSRSAQDVKNANNVTIHATSGLLTWNMQPADNAILDNNLSFEQHRALFEWVYDTTKEGKHTVDIEVRNLNFVT